MEKCKYLFWLFIVGLSQITYAEDVASSVNVDAIIQPVKNDSETPQKEITDQKEPSVGNVSVQLPEVVTGLKKSDVIYIVSPIRYEEGASVVEKVRAECAIEEVLTKDLVDTFLTRNQSVSENQLDEAAAKIAYTVSTPPEKGYAIETKIRFVMGVGGGGWSGPKGITIGVTLFKDRQAIAERKIHRTSTGGMFSGFKGTCSIMDRISGVLAKDTLRWVERSYE